MTGAGVIGRRQGALALAARGAAGTVFVVFGVGKFTRHSAEVSSFASYGLPYPDAFAYAIGVVELVGGALLIIGLATRPAALVLAGDMVGAITVSGIARGETISLTLAPTLLVVCLLLIWTGPGRSALGQGGRRPGRGGVRRRGIEVTHRSASRRPRAGRHRPHRATGSRSDSCRRHD